MEQEREYIIEKRKQVGDFELDFVIFIGQKYVLDTNISRTTRLARIELMVDKAAPSSICVQKKYSLGNGRIMSKYLFFYVG